MPEHDRAAADVHVLPVEPEEPVVRDGDDRERLVDLPEVHVLRRQARLAERHLHRVRGGDRELDRPPRFARSALMSTTAAPPSLIDEEFAAVTLPSFLNTGFRAGIFSGFAPFGPSSSATTVFSPLRPSISTGTISALNAPDLAASIARRVDSIAYSSCCAREIPCVVAQCSAQMPMWCWPYTSQSPSWIMPSTSSTLPIRTPVRAARS